MPQHKSCEKRIKQADKSRERNRFYKSTMRSEMKKLRNMSVKDEAAAQLKKCFSILDKLAKKKIIHKSNADNHKAKLTKFVNKLA